MDYVLHNMARRILLNMMERGKSMSLKSSDVKREQNKLTPEKLVCLYV